MLQFMGWQRVRHDLATEQQRFKFSNRNSANSFSIKQILLLPRCQAPSCHLITALLCHNLQVMSGLEHLYRCLSLPFVWPRLGSAQSVIPHLFFFSLVLHLFKIDL